MPLDLLGGRAIENETNRILLVLPNLTSDVITMLKFIDKTLASVVKEESTDTTEGLSGQELDFGVRLVGVDETSRVYLDLLEIDGAGTNAHGKLLSVAGTMFTVRGRKVPELGAVSLEERVLCEIGSITTSSKDDGSISGLSLAVADVFNTSNSARLVLEDLGDMGFLQDLHAFRIADGKILETLHLSVGDNHSRELGITTMGTGLAVATETGDL